MLEALLERYHFELYSIHGADSRNSLFVYSCSILISGNPSHSKRAGSMSASEICNDKVNMGSCRQSEAYSHHFFERMFITHMRGYTSVTVLLNSTNFFSIKFFSYRE